MGTRHITIASIDGETKIAQYGDFDGGELQAERIITFLREYYQEPFKAKLRQTKWVDKEEVKARLYAGAGRRPGELTSEDVRLFGISNPQFDYGTGAMILRIVAVSDAGVELIDNRYREPCEGIDYFHVLDYDKGTYSIYHLSRRTPPIFTTPIDEPASVVEALDAF